MTNSCRRPNDGGVLSYVFRPTDNYGTMAIVQMDIHSTFSKLAVSTNGYQSSLHLLPSKNEYFQGKTTTAELMQQK